MEGTMKKAVMILLSALLAALMLSSCTGVGGEDKTTTALQIATDENGVTVQAPPKGVLSSFSSDDIDGNPVNADIFTGKKLTMINIWATYCGPCISEMPELGELAKEYADKGVQIIGIPCDIVDRKGVISQNLLNEAREIINTTGADYLHIVPSESLNTAILDAVYAVPETLFVDENGAKIGGSYVGARSKAEWRDIIEQLLAHMQ